MKSLATLISRNAELAASHDAILFEGEVCSFEDHYIRSLKLASALRQSGCQNGDRVAILAQNCVEYLEFYSACQLSGFIAVPVNFRLSAEEVSYICDNTTPTCLFYGSTYEGHIEALKRTKSGIADFVQINRDNQGSNEFESFLNGGEVKESAFSPQETDPACIIHTSGTTGKPKGAVLSHGGLYGIADTISRDAEISEHDFGLVMQPLFHVGALFLQLAHHIRAAKINLLTGFDPQWVWKVLSEQPITTMQLVPTMLHMMLEEFSEGSHPETRLRTIFYSTAPISESLLRRGLDVFGQVFLQQYGSTEGGQITSLSKQHHIKDGNESEQRWLRSAGRPNPEVDLCIQDTEGNVLSSHEAGEICVRHKNLMLGYWNEPEATDVAMKNGYLHMGDIGYRDDDGFLYIVDRKKDMIISGGENIYPREVEKVLQTHPNVIEVAVVGIPDDRWGESVLAFVVSEGGSKLSKETLINYCKERIASYKKPRQVELLDSLPRNSMGKVDKVALRKPYWEDRNRSV